MINFKVILKYFNLIKLKMQLRNGKTYIYKEKDLYDCKESKPLTSENGIFIYNYYLNILRWLRSFF